MLLQKMKVRFSSLYFFLWMTDEDDFGSRRFESRSRQKRPLSRFPPPGWLKFCLAFVFRSKKVLCWWRRCCCCCCCCGCWWRCWGVNDVVVAVVAVIVVAVVDVALVAAVVVVIVVAVVDVALVAAVDVVVVAAVAVVVVVVVAVAISEEVSDWPEPDLLLCVNFQILDDEEFTKRHKDGHPLFNLLYFESITKWMHMI